MGTSTSSSSSYALSQSSSETITLTHLITAADSSFLAELCRRSSDEKTLTDIKVESSKLRDCHLPMREDELRDCHLPMQEDELRDCHLPMQEDDMKHFSLWFGGVDKSSINKQGLNDEDTRSFVTARGRIENSSRPQVC